MRLTRTAAGGWKPPKVASRRLRWALLLSFSSIATLAAQEHSESAFETASVRPIEPTPRCVSMLPPGGTHFSMTCFTLRQLIATAWGVDPDDIRGEDGAALATYYDVRATTPGDKPWTFDQARAMLNRLLNERFNLTMHAGSRRQAGYGLFVAKNGFKLTPVTYNVQKDGVTARAASHK
jgi:uncharacterized protein (TIGR03435 family)